MCVQQLFRLLWQHSECDSSSYGGGDGGGVGSNEGRRMKKRILQQNEIRKVPRRYADRIFNNGMWCQAQRASYSQMFHRILAFFDKVERIWICGIVHSNQITFVCSHTISESFECVAQNGEILWCDREIIVTPIPRIHFWFRSTVNSVRRQLLPRICDDGDGGCSCKWIAMTNLLNTIYLHTHKRNESVLLLFKCQKLREHLSPLSHACSLQFTDGGGCVLIKNSCMAQFCVDSSKLAAKSFRLFLAVSTVHNWLDAGNRQGEAKKNFSKDSSRSVKPSMVGMLISYLEKRISIYDSAPVSAWYSTINYSVRMVFGCLLFHYLFISRTANGTLASLVTARRKNAGMMPRIYTWLSMSMTTDWVVDRLSWCSALKAWRHTHTHNHRQI